MCEQGTEMIEIRLSHTTKGKKTHVKVDRCIAGIIQMFNNEGYQTVASCCGHGVRPGVITLENGTELILCYSYKQTRMIEKLYPGLHEEMDGVIPPPMNVDNYAVLVNELEGKIDHFEAFIKELGEENEGLTEARDRCARHVRQEEIKYEKLEEENAELTKARDRLFLHVCDPLSYEMQCEDLKEENAALVNDRDNLKDRISELFEENVELVKKRAIDIQKMESQWEDIQQLIKDRDEQKQGWDASVGVIDQFIIELNNQRKEIEDLNKVCLAIKERSRSKENEIVTLQQEIEDMTKTIDVLRDGHTQEELNDIEEYKKNIIMLQGMFNDVKDERDNLKVTISALRTASKFKKEYDPKWQKDNLRLDKENANLKQAFKNMQVLHFDEKNEIKNLKDEIKSLGECHVEDHVRREEISRLNKELERIHGHWHRQTSGYMNKIKNQRRQLKSYQNHIIRLKKRINTLYPYIAHGTMDHRKWLRNAIDDHFDMNKNDPAPKLSMETKTFNQGGFFKEGGLVDGT